MNIIARLGYELAYYDSAVHRFNHYTTRTPPRIWKTRPYNDKKKNLPNWVLCFLGWPQSKTERKRKKDKYLDLAKEPKKLWNMKVTVILIVIGVLGTVNKGLVQGLQDLEIRRRVETIQTTAFLRSAKILKSVLETSVRNHRLMLV